MENNTIHKKQRRFVKAWQSKPSLVPTATYDDLISELPDELLHNILSFLDMDSVFQTSLLSKRWRYLWISLPFLYFDHDLYFHKRLYHHNYMSFVERVLCLRKSSSPSSFTSKIHTFRLSYLDFNQNEPTLDDDECKIDRIINETVLQCNSDDQDKSNIQQLDLHIDTGYRIPQCIYSSNSSLTTLKLEGITLGLSSVDLSVAAPVSLPCLKTLHLISIIIEEDDKNGISFEKFILGCPVLETLVFCNSLIMWSRVVTISALRLENLEIENVHSKKNVTKDIIVNAPNLKSFKCRNTGQDYSLENVSCLVKVDMWMDLGDSDEKDMETKSKFETNYIKFLKRIYNVTYLTLCEWALKALNENPVSFGSHIPTFHNVRYLKFRTTTTSFTKAQLRGIMYLLEKCPNVDRNSCFRMIS